MQAQEENHEEEHKPGPESPHGEQQPPPLGQTQENTQTTQQKSKQKPIVPPRDGPKEGQRVIDFEVCQNCSAHAWCTHHDEDKYTNLFLACREAIESALPDVYCTLNENKKPTTGAFEVTYKDQGKPIFSKKNSQLFPQPQALAERVKLYLQEVENGADMSKWANKKERKYEPPRQIKERPTFQSYMKQREEQERRQKEEAERLKQEQEEKERLEREEQERQEQERQRQLEEEEHRRKEEEEQKRIAEEKAAEEQERQRQEEAQYKEEQEAQNQENQEQKQNEEQNQQHNEEQPPE